VLKDHPASVAAKLTAFAVMTALTAAYVQNEIGISASALQRQALTCSTSPTGRAPAPGRGPARSTATCPNANHWRYAT
jgi:hypothetical protein